MLEWIFLASLALVYNSYLQSTIDVPSDHEALIFGQYQLYEKTTNYNPNAKLTIVIRSIEGRLGNNMFQYASSLGIVNSLQLPDSVTFCMHPQFNLPYLEEAVEGPLLPNCDQDDLKTMWEIGDPQYATHHEVKLPPCEEDQCTYALKGYFQSWKYFEKYKSSVRKQFQFKPEIRQQVQDYFTEIGNAPIKIGIHVRKGDMAIRDDFYLRDPPLSYYQKAMAHFSDFYGSIQFIVVSDDPDWCEQQSVFRDAVIVRNHTAPVDMALLSLCHHVIMSRGTFGWWAAYLSGSKAVYYKDAFVLEHPENLGRVNLDDHYPANWIGLSA